MTGSTYRIGGTEDGTHNPTGHSALDEQQPSGQHELARHVKGLPPESGRPVAFREKASESEKYSFPLTFSSSCFFKFINAFLYIGKCF